MNCPAAVDLTGTWTTGAATEPKAKRLVRHPGCNSSPEGSVLLLLRTRPEDNHAVGLTSPIDRQRQREAQRRLDELHCLACLQ